MTTSRHRFARLTARRLGAAAAILLFVAAASAGIENCGGGEEGAIKDAIEADARGGIDVGTIDVHGDSADATTFFEGHDVEVELSKEAGKWIVEKCVNESTQECPLNNLGTSP